MPDSPGEAARFLTRNAVDALPEGELEQQLGQGRPLRVKLGDRPHRARHPPRSHGRPAQAARVPGPRPHGRPDHRRLHGARGGPQRPLRRTPGRSPGRRSTATPRPTSDQAFKVLDPERTEVRRNGEWLDMPMEDLFRLARTSTVAQLLERDDFAKRYAGAASRSRCSSCSTRCCRATTRSPCESDVELGGTDQKFNLLLGARHPAGLRGRAAVDPHDADPAGHRRRAADVEVAGQLRRGRPSRPRRSSASSCASRTPRCRSTTTLLLDDAFDPARRPCETKRGLARGADRALPRRGGRGGGRGALRPPPRRARGSRTTSRSSRFSPATARCTCRRCCATPSGCRAPRRAGCSRRAGVKLDGEPLASRRARPARPSASTGPSSRSGKRRFGRLRDSGLTRAPSPVLHCSVAPDEERRAS